jgi:replication-associated recombination protein RarA
LASSLGEEMFVASTSGGYDLHELFSALQKCIRRGMEYEAVHFAAEIEAFGKSGPTILWNRLKIIACEDVGPANPVMPLIIDLLFRQYQTEKSKLGDSSDRLFLVNAVVCLCRSSKSRIADDLLNIVYAEREEGKHIPIPDFALDMHTKKGVAMGRGNDYFFSEGNKLENEAFPNPYTQKAKTVLEKRCKTK